MEEVWKPIPKYLGLYEVSSLGNVRNKRGLILKFYVINSGYKCLKLYKDGKHRAYLIHRLVAEAFLESIEGYNVVNHKDSNRLNNSLENLEWVSHQGNIRHAMEAGNHSKMYTNKNSLGKKHLKNTSSKYHNVTYIKDKGTWQAYINFKGIKARVFTSELEAAQYINYLIDKYNIEGRTKNDVPAREEFTLPRRNKFRVQIINTLTQDTIEFLSIKECAEYFDKYPSSIQSRLRSGKELNGFKIIRNEIVCQ